MTKELKAKSPNIYLQFYLNQQTWVSEEVNSKFQDDWILNFIFLDLGSSSQQSVIKFEILKIIDTSLSSIELSEVAGG